MKWSYFLLPVYKLLVLYKMLKENAVKKGKKKKKKITFG